MFSGKSSLFCDRSFLLHIYMSPNSINYEIESILTSGGFSVALFRTRNSVFVIDSHTRSQLVFSNFNGKV